MIQNHIGAGDVRVRILKYPFHRRIYYDEYRRINDRNQDSQHYIPVQAGDRYAIEVTFLRGFNMKDNSHASSRFFQAGHKQHVRMETYSHFANPRYNAEAEEQVLTSNVVQTIDEKKKGWIDGKYLRNMKFAVRGLMPDPTLSPNHIYSNGASAEDLSKIEVGVFCYKTIITECSREEMDAKRQRNAHRREFEQERRQLYHADNDTWTRNKKVDPKSYAKGITHTHDYVNGKRIQHLSAEEYARIYTFDRPVGNTTRRWKRDDYTMFTFRFAAIEHLENGDYVKVEGIKDEESKVKIKKEAALKLKREQKLKREEDVKRESVDSDIQPYSKFSNPALKRSREESEPPFVKKQKTSRSSPALSQIPSFDQEVIQLDLDSEDETFQMIRRSRSSSAPKEIIRLDLDSDDEDIQMIRRQRSESLGKFVRESAPSLSPSLSNNHRRRPVIDLDTEDQDDGMFVPMARRSIARTPTPN